MSTARRAPLAQIFNEMHAVLVGVGKNYCFKSQAHCEECPLRIFLAKDSPQSPGPGGAGGN
jgi:endonuclease III-like uncharacterized protein